MIPEDAVPHEAAFAHPSGDEAQHILGIVEFACHGFVVARSHQLHVRQFSGQQGILRRGFADLREVLRGYLVLLHLHEKVAGHLQKFGGTADAAEGLQLLLALRGDPAQQHHAAQGVDRRRARGACFL